MIRILAVLMCVVALPASAQSVYKCKDAKLGTVYQSTPCPDGNEQKRWNTATSSAPSDNTRQQATGVKASGTNTNANFGAQLIGSMSRTPSAENCARAKEVRDGALKDPSMNQDVDFILATRKLVSEACK
jgi:hypothetical protein